MSQFSLLTLLFDQLPLGLVVLDARGKVVVFNRAEEKLAARSRERVLGASFFEEVAPCMNVRELGHQFTERIGRAPIDETVEMSFAFPHAEHPRDVSVRMCSFDVDEAPHAFLLVEDISHKRSAARMREQLQSLLVHDLKNPLSAATRRRCRGRMSSRRRLQVYVPDTRKIARRASKEPSLRTGLHPG